MKLQIFNFRKQKAKCSSKKKKISNKGSKQPIFYFRKQTANFQIQKANTQFSIYESKHPIFKLRKQIPIFHIKKANGQFSN